MKDSEEWHLIANSTLKLDISISCYDEYSMQTTRRTRVIKRVMLERATASATISYKIIRAELA